MTHNTIVVTIVEILLVSSLPRKAYSIQCQHVQEVYDIAFEFQDNCSLTVYWTSPECIYSVVRYTVQSAQGCPSEWTNTTTKSNETFLEIEDRALFTACLLGECYVRVLAEFDGDSERVYSHCVGIGDSFHDPSFRQST